MADAISGVSDHAGWAVLVTVGEAGGLLDRRRIELVDPGLPTLPHHHDAQHLPDHEATRLIEQVRQAALRHATEELDSLSRALDTSIRAIALRECPRLPQTTVEQVRSYWAQTRADGVMYREALAAAARSRGWRVHWFNAKTVITEAAATTPNLAARFREVGKSIGPPWTNDHRVAMAAAIVAARNTAV